MSLRSYLARHQITQAEFGRQLDPPVSQGKVNHWLHGTRRVSLAEGLQIVSLTGGEVSLEGLAELAASAQVSEPAVHRTVGEGAHA